MTKKMLNGEIMEMTAEEIKIDNEFLARNKIHLANLEKAKEEEKTKKASGKQKLLDLGLSEEEVKALIGI